MDLSPSSFAGRIIRSRAVHIIVLVSIVVILVLVKLSFTEKQDCFEIRNAVCTADCDKINFRLVSGFSCRHSEVVCCAPKD